MQRLLLITVGSAAAVWRLVMLSLMCLLASACATGHAPAKALSRMPPLDFQGRVIGHDQVHRLAPTPSLLDVDDVMRNFAHRYTADASSPRQRLRNLHRAVTGSATLGVDYDPAAQGSARETFHAQTANCLAYANLFIALAREVGLDARYQWVDLRPQWTRMGERVAVRLHVNTVVHLTRRERLMVDLDPLPARDITDSREISDTDAQALFHSNIAMDALAGEQIEAAWANAVRALQLSPGMSHLWVNLGVVYRHAGHYPAAESAYMQALAVDAYDRSAMNNLMVLYGVQGREKERAEWELRVTKYRDRNPYYHAWLGDQAAEKQDWRDALAHYREAMSLAPADPGLMFSTGLIFRQLGELKAALRYIDEARRHATLVSEKQAYTVEYEQISRRLLAGQ